MAKHQFIVAYVVLVGIAAVYSQFHEDAQLRREGKSVLDRQDWPEGVIRRVRRFTPHERSEMVGASPHDIDVHKNLQVFSAALRVIQPPNRVNQRPEDHQRHIDRIEQERLYRLRKRQQQQAADHQRHVDRMEQERLYRLRERQRQQAADHQRHVDRMEQERLYRLRERQRQQDEIRNYRGRNVRRYP